MELSSSDAPRTKRGGVVVSEVDKRVAADIVQQTVGVLTVRNNLEIKGQIRG